MIVSPFVAVVLLAAPLQVAAPDLSAVDVDTKRVTFYTEHFGQALTRAGMTVVTSKQMQAVLGLERQKELMGCTSESASCIAELASALGADAILSGTVARVGRSYRLSLNLVSAKDAATLSVHQAKLDDENALLDELDRVAPRMAREALIKLRPSEATQISGGVTQASSSATFARRYAWVPAVGGLVLAGAGTALYISSNSRLEVLTRGQFTRVEDAEAARDSGKLQRGLAYTGFGLGAAGLAAAAVMFFTGGDGPSVAVIPNAEGAALSLGGTF